MEKIKSFVYYSFRWQFKVIFIVSLCTILSLVTIGLFPMFGSETGMFLVLFLLFFTVVSALSNLRGFNHNVHDESSFSSKYLYALPFSKKELLSSLILSSAISLAPILIAIIWSLIFFKSINFEKTSKFQGLLNFMFQFPVTTFASVIFIYPLLVIFQIRSSIEASRQMYNKKFINKFMLGISSVLSVAAYGLLIIVFVIFGVVNNMLFVIPIMLLILVGWHFHRTHKLMVKESQSYWDWKRDFASLVLRSFVCIGFFAWTISFNSKSNNYDINSWAYHYASGEKIFYSVTSRDTKEIEKYIKVNGPIDLKNHRGVSLIHTFSTLNFSKIKGLEDYYLKNPSLLLIPIKTEDQNCKDSLYCNGVTPLHILAASGNSAVLKKALEKLPEGISVLTSEKKSPLHYSSFFCMYETSKVLVDYGADINLIANKSMTPLMEAASKGCIASSLVLLKAGANKDFKNDMGLGAIEIAKGSNYNELAFLMEFVTF